jgi:hypothetical protein
VAQLHVAVTAAQGLPAEVLLGLASGAAEHLAPLTAALAFERLRQATTVLPKDEWQGVATQVCSWGAAAGCSLVDIGHHGTVGHCARPSVGAALVLPPQVISQQHLTIAQLCGTQVLRAAMHADAEPAHPFDLAAPWLAALAWVADSRWRRLPAGPHLEALAGWVEALELRAVALRLAQPADFGLEGGSPGGSQGQVVSKLHASAVAGQPLEGFACPCLAMTCTDECKPVQ